MTGQAERVLAGVVVGLIEAPWRDDAVALATTLAAPGGRITLAHVIVPDPLLHGVVAEGPRAREMSRVQAWLEEQAARLRENERVRELGVEVTTRAVQRPTTGEGLHAIAEEEEADVIVVGSSRRGLLGRVLLGDDTRAALDGAPCAVAVAPAGYRRRPRPLRHVGVGFDGSPESRRAVELAKRIARRAGAEVSAFTAVSVPVATLGPRAELADEASRAMRAHARERILAVGGLQPRVAFGEAVPELEAFSKSLDLLILGSRSRGPWGRLVHGSTTRELTRRAHCPLLVITRPRQTQVLPGEGQVGDRGDGRCGQPLDGGGSDQRTPSRG